MIEVPQTRLPSFSTSICASISLARLTNLALARAWSPRWLVIRTSRLTAFKRPLPRGSRWPRRYICVPPPRGGDSGVNRHHLARALEPDEHRQVDAGDHL